MVFQKRHNLLEDNVLQLKIDGQQINQVKDHKFLGVYIDNFMYWTKQIQVEKVTKAAAITARLKHHLPQSALK